MTQYKFTVGSSPQSLIGNLTWNANGTLQTQNITDPFNSANTQNCSYGYDDVSRLGKANCGSAAAQTFTYDPFGNINKSGSPYSFQPSYSSATNHMSSIGSFTPTYDSVGDVTNDESATGTLGVSKDAYKAFKNNAVMTNGPNSFTTLKSAHGSAQPVLGNGTNHSTSFLGKAAKVGATAKGIADVGLSGALVLDCAVGKIH